jgi:hypothetical protein
MKKLYTYEQVTYGSAGQKWVFNGPAFQLKTALPGGVDTANRVARIVSGALKRTNGDGLDNLGRANIASIVDKARQRLIEC